MKVEKDMIIVSACLAGVNCNYKGSNKENEKVVKLVKKGEAIIVCPEQFGGLVTPRKPAEIRNGKVITTDNEDVTEAFEKGANEVLNICKKYNCTKAILRAKSPSCGCGEIFDGSFSDKLIKGDGVTAKLLKKNGIEVISEKDI